MATDWTSFALSLLLPFALSLLLPFVQSMLAKCKVFKQGNSTTHQMSDSHLLNLPAELRMTIFEMAIATDTCQVLVDATGYARPALLATCKQTRAEALDLFYSSNQFRINIPTFDDGPILEFGRAVKAMGVTDVKVVFVNRSPGWDNLSKWLENLHFARHSWGFVSRSADNAELQIIGGLFGTITTLRGVKWKQVKEVVELMRPALIALDARWAD